MKPPDDEEVALYWASPRRRRLNRAVLGFLEGASRRWLLLANLATGAVAGGAVLTPVLAAAGLTGLSASIFECYRFICSQTPSHSYELLGYQMPLCQRDLAIYSGMLLSGLVYWIVRPGRALDWKLYGLLALPMAVDGLTQLAGWRESNWQLRTLTGLLFGLATVWFAYPELGNAARPHLREDAPA